MIDYNYWVFKYYEYNCEMLREDGLADTIPDDDPTPMVDQALSFWSEEDYRKVFKEKFDWIKNDSEFKSMYPKYYN